MLEGLVDLSLLGYIGLTLALTHITIASVTIFLHRHQAHRALYLHPIASHFFRFWIWLTTGMVTKEWVAVHRKHHAKCESMEDPHSPQVSGIWSVLFGGVGLYRAATRDPEILTHYGKGTPDDWLERQVYGRFRYLGVLIMAALDVALFGTIGLVIFAVQMIWIPFWAAGVINGLGHFWGYRNFETPDASRNLSPIGLLIGGEELHNNHHGHAQSAKLSSRWWEFDIGWLYIRMLSLLGLAKIRRVAPRIMIAPEKEAVDLETVRAVVSNRYRILKLYGRKVIRPIVRAERRVSHGEERTLLRRVRKLMSREGAVLNERQQAVLNKVLECNQTLDTVFRFKTQLKALWGHDTGGGAKRVERLRVWCADAERSGIQRLEDFATVLRAYTLQSA
jgi:stearoyl-CoA desaturase (delta-9 desaturase)